VATTAPECSIGRALRAVLGARGAASSRDSWDHPGFIGSRPSRCIFLRASLRARRIASRRPPIEGYIEDPVWLHVSPKRSRRFHPGSGTPLSRNYNGAVHRDASQTQ
jgi:hypothetical protein